MQNNHILAGLLAVTVIAGMMALQHENASDF